MNHVSRTLRSACRRSIFSPIPALRSSLISIFCIVALSGCVVTEGEDDWLLDSTRNHVLSFNNLSSSSVSTNRLGFNGLSTNVLSFNRLHPDVLELNQQAAGNLAATESGRELLAYVARCALMPGDHLHVEHGARSWTYPGVLGLAPEWERAPLTQDGRELITACLMAHVNAFRIQVPISVRSDALPPAEAEESSTYFHGDGVFYGDLFARTPAKYACKIRANDYLDETTKSWQPAQSPHAGERVCAGENTAEDCDFEFTGYCDEVCGDIRADGAQWHFSDCLGADGARYANTASVWLVGESAESCSTAPVGFTCDPN